MNYSSQLQKRNILNKKIVALNRFLRNGGFLSQNEVKLFGRLPKMNSIQDVKNFKNSLQREKNRIQIKPQYMYNNSFTYLTGGNKAQKTINSLYRIYNRMSYENSPVYVTNKRNLSLGIPKSITAKQVRNMIEKLGNDRRWYSKMMRKNLPILMRKPINTRYNIKPPQRPLRNNINKAYIRTYGDFPYGYSNLKKQVENDIKGRWIIDPRKYTENNPSEKAYLIYKLSKR